MIEKKQITREHYYHKFLRINNMESYDFQCPHEIEETSRYIVDELKRRDLTIDEAIASLERAYNIIKYEANFLKLQ